MFKKNTFTVLLPIVILVLAFAAVSFILTKSKPAAKKEKIPKGGEIRMKITSKAFANNGFIPQKYTCDGQDINPPLTIKEVPANTKSLVLMVDDPDAPMGVWTHWLVWNIDPKTTEIKEGTVPQGAVLGKNDFGKPDYGGPCPPRGTHRYFFKVFALDVVLNLPSGASRSQLEKAMENHIVGQGQLMGKYSR